MIINALNCFSISSVFVKFELQNNKRRIINLYIYKKYKP